MQQSVVAMTEAYDVPVVCMKSNENKDVSENCKVINFKSSPKTKQKRKNMTRVRIYLFWKLSFIV
jgi:hypothetical protein